MMEFRNQILETLALGTRCAARGAFRLPCLVNKWRIETPHTGGDNPPAFTPCFNHRPPARRDAEIDAENAFPLRHAIPRWCEQPKEDYRKKIIDLCARIGNSVCARGNRLGSHGKVVSPLKDHPRSVPPDGGFLLGGPDPIWERARRGGFWPLRPAP